MRRVTRCRTDDAGKHAQEQKLDEIQRENIRLRRTQATHHRGTIHLPLRKPAGGQRHGYRCQHHREQGGKPQKPLRPLKCDAHFRARIANTFDALATLQFACERRPELFYNPGLTREQKTVGGATADLYQTCSFQILHIQHHTWRNTEVVQHAIGFLDDDRRNFQL